MVNKPFKIILCSTLVSIAISKTYNAAKAELRFPIFALQ